MSNKLFLLLLVAAIQVVRVAALNMAISPVHVREGEVPSSVTFSCAADSALAKCQFSLWDVDQKPPRPVLELSRGPQSQAVPDHLNDKLTGYSYTGRGLGAGDCGVSLKVKGYKTWIVACRVRAETGGWKYAWADLYAHANFPFPNFNLTTPREVVVFPGGDGRFSVKAQEPLVHCKFYVPSMTKPLHFDEGAGSYLSSGRHLYLGDGLKGGECGLALTNVSEADNGPVTVFIAASGYKYEVISMALIVAYPPPAPTISLVYEGTNLTATCSMGNSRPVANISWILGDKVIRQDESDDSQDGLDDTWRWPWMEGSNLQTLTLELKPEDQGQVLKCVVSHVALAQPHEARAIISITDSSTATTSGTTISATPSTTASTVPELICRATNVLDLLCLQLAQQVNTSCPKDEVRKYRVREAKAAARTAELGEEVARVTLQVATMKLEAEKITIEAAKSRYRAEEARAQNAEEELKSERERRAKDQKTVAEHSE